MDDNKQKKANKILIAVIAVFAVVIIGLLIALLKPGRNDKKDTTNEAVTEASKSDADVQDADSKSEEEPSEKETDEEATEELICYASVSSTNSWENNGKYSGQLDVSITNKSSSDIKDWSVKIDIGKETTVDS
ncbi:MAG: hypothetical protein IJ053_07195, partial [Lachnospiraceae bacterium]|nr:hypothetical protein [Lachnospiraceae bacterium]